MRDIPFAASFKTEEEEISQDLISLNREGFLVGPNEERPAFFARVDRDKEKGDIPFLKNYPVFLILDLVIWKSFTLMKVLEGGKGAVPG